MSTTGEADRDYDVVIVGGRPAGASLAMRLGARGHRVLVVDRARFPSAPAVPSSPMIYPGAMRILEALGIPEAEYASASVRLSALRLQFDRYVDTMFVVPQMWGRDYVYGIDRAGFDEVLWRHVGGVASVERREGFAVTELLREPDGRVIGVIGSERGGTPEQLRARCVVGADGRFSLVARKAGAAIIEEQTRCLSTVYYATWEGMALDDDTSVLLHATGRGLDVLCLPVPGGQVVVNTHERADRVNIEGDAQGYYIGRLRGIGEIDQRLRDARQVSELVGIKRIGNGYRQASGPGWVLVGDAVHYKDPADGQGIYDALLGAELLYAAVAGYARALQDATHPMYRETVARLRRELYEEPPAFIANTLIRWTLSDPAYQRQFMNYLGRTISPVGWNSPSLMAGAVARGIWRDLGSAATRPTA
jgi:flavin-dependent dehydrogenase